MESWRGLRPSPVPPAFSRGSAPRAPSSESSWLSLPWGKKCFGIMLLKNKHGNLGNHVKTSTFHIGSPGQTTMLMRFVSKFCVEPRSPFSNISHQDPKTIWKTPNIVSWPECQPEFPGDGGGGDGGVPRTLPSGQTPNPSRPGTKYPVRGIPHFDMPGIITAQIWSVRSISFIWIKTDLCLKVGTFEQPLKKQNKRSNNYFWHTFHGAH